MRYSASPSTFLRDGMDSPLIAFKLPPRDAFGSDADYAIYNYYGNGPIARAKRARFERALKLAAKYCPADNVIDMGCADGVLLPTLSSFYKRVVAIDQAEAYLDVSRKLVVQLNLSN